MLDLAKTNRIREDMTLWKNRQRVDDDWQFVDDDAPLPETGPIFVTLNRWRDEHEILATRNAPIGLVFAPDSDWSDIVDELPRFPAIAVTMEKFADGRAFSIARLLRDRDGYAGEIRAVGDYFIDQVPMMARVGIDAFQTEDPILNKAFENGEWPEVDLYLQPAIGDVAVPGETRPWARKPRPE